MRFTRRAQAEDEGRAHRGRRRGCADRRPQGQGRPSRCARSCTCAPSNRRGDARDHPPNAALKGSGPAGGAECTCVHPIAAVTRDSNRSPEAVRQARMSARPHRFCMSSLKMRFSSALAGVGEALEAAGVRDQLGRAHDPAPRRARQRAADADAPHAELGESLTVRSLGPPISTLTGFGATALTTARDLLARRDARRIEAIGAGCGDRPGAGGWSRRDRAGRG